MAGDRGGASVILFAVALPVLVLIVGIAVDYGYMSVSKTRLQGLADAAATAAAREYHVANTDPSQIQAVAESVVNAHLGAAAASVTVSAQFSSNPVSVSVDLSQNVDTFFMKNLSEGDTTISARAVARLVGGTPVCVIGLDSSASRTVSLDSNSRLTAPTCAVFSNSTSTTGLSSQSNALLSAQLICSAGGTQGSGSNYNPTALTDCPPIDDPLASRPAPPIGSCTAYNLEIIDMTTMLLPGVYCGGLRIDGNARVFFRPGVYVIKDGPLEIDSNSEIEGSNVGFYFHGNNATFRFASNAKVTLTAPKDGPMAGLLFFEAHGSPALRPFEILSNYARVLVGTIYLPHGRFIIDADNEVADQSAYTAIVARRVELYAGPNLTLNTDYGLTDVPVPEGIGAAGQNVVLAE